MYLLLVIAIKHCFITVGIISIIHQFQCAFHARA